MASVSAPSELGRHQLPSTCPEHDPGTSSRVSMFTSSLFTGFNQKTNKQATKNQRDEEDVVQSGKNDYQVSRNTNMTTFRRVAASLQGRV
ncbi:uncharacterized protein SPSK_08192 [Sporothrix schenckii 1099-18]|uniref:Uncharacterized protein n=1 Tax=Sporothrix schenckii 1099-18 TaxID=1397361 RepID=A0A0F2MKI6_SPOSC|nr:uncharacterized protein SPSK_08192 [Sporothrix schenckii 1099-18]KJR88701.1 hypothetical protein SPSK_08192 [Sporothrix schenckii 1099-18]